MMLQHTIPATGSNDSCLQHKMPVKFHWAKKILQQLTSCKKAAIQVDEDLYRLKSRLVMGFANLPKDDTHFHHLS